MEDAETTAWVNRARESAERTSAIERYLTLKAMDTLIERMNDIRAMNEWEYVMPYPKDEEAMMATAASTAHFAEAAGDFIRIMQDYLAAGLLVDGVQYERSDENGRN